MTSTRTAKGVLEDWRALPRQLDRLTRGLRESDLDARAAPDQMSVRETVHHLVEANLIASNMVIAALANSGSTYDWTWVNPGGTWLARLGYATAPIGPALATLDGLTRHFAALLSALDDGLERKIELYDSPGAPHYVKTVGQLLADEVAHAREHLQNLPRRHARGRAATAGRRT